MKVIKTNVSVNLSKDFLDYVDRTIGKKFPEKTQITLLYNLTTDNTLAAASDQQAVYVHTHTFMHASVHTPHHKRVIDKNMHAHAAQHTHNSPAITKH